MILRYVKLDLTHVPRLQDLCRMAGVGRILTMHFVRALQRAECDAYVRIRERMTLAGNVQVDGTLPRKVLDQRQQSSVCFSNWKSQKQCSQEKRQKRQDAKESPSACDGTGRGGAQRARDICSFAHSSCILSRNASPDRELASGPRMWNFLSTFKNEPLVSSAMVTWPGAVSVQRTALEIKKLFARLKKSPVRCPCSIDKKQCRRWRVRSVWIAPGRPWSITYPQRSWWKIHKVPQAFFAHQVHAWAWRKNLGHLTAKTFLRQLTKIWWRPQ